MTPERVLPTPPENIEYEEFWAACGKGKLTLPRCKDTSRFFWYPRKISPFTLSNNIEWVEATGKGEIYSYSVMRRSVPEYVIAYVRLEEGVTIMTNIVECDPENITVGQKVVLVMRETVNGQKVPVFKPAG